MADTNIQLPSLPAASQANETDLLLARQGSTDKKLTVGLLKDLILNGSDFTGADILSLLLPVDGDGSGLDADLLDGQHGDYYLDAANLTGTVSSTNLDANDILDLVKTVDGSGSGLDADTLDGLDSGNFVRTSTDQTIGGAKTFTGTLEAYYSGDTPNLSKTKFGRDTSQYFALYGDTSGNILASVSSSGDPKDSILFGVSTDGGASLDSTYTLNGDSGTIWHSGNDGSGSGLDADTLDGQEGSYYRNASNLNSGTVASDRLPSASFSSKGAVEWATQSEVNNGTSGKAVSADKLRNGVQYSLGSTGYIRFPSWLGHLTIQWGNTSVLGNNTAVAYFPKTFSSVFQAVAAFGHDIGNDANSVAVVNLYTSSMTIRSTGSTGRVNWIAIGVS